MLTSVPILFRGLHALDAWACRLGPAAGYVMGQMELAGFGPGGSLDIATQLSQVVAVARGAHIAVDASGLVTRATRTLQ
jgi:hypothetical protein